MARSARWPRASARSPRRSSWGSEKSGCGVARGLATTDTRLFAADIDERRRRDAEQLGATWLPAADALRADVDLLVPAAIGGMITYDLVGQIRCRCVLGPANNQLDDPGTAEELHAHGITWAPDTVVSAGGVIHAVAIERERGVTAQQARQRVMAIGDTLTAILDEARSRGVSPARAARERASPSWHGHRDQDALLR